MKEITFEDIQKANDTIKTTDIKGKEYAEVNQRIKAFRMIYPEGTIETEMQSNNDGICIFKAWVYAKKVWVENVGDEPGYWKYSQLLGTGTAYEKENSSFINKTSYIENCETSAVGRALGMAGFGIDTSIASFEEVANAVRQQEIDEKKISKTQEEALDKAIENRKIPDETVYKILAKYNYTSTAEIKMKDYMNIVNEFQKLVQK